MSDQPTRVLSVRGKIPEQLDTIPGLVYVGRPMRRHPHRAVKAGSIWGNPFQVMMPASKARSILEGEGFTGWQGLEIPRGSMLNLGEVLACYIAHIRSRPDLVAQLPSLRGKVLACWCGEYEYSPEGAVSLPCHAAILAVMAHEGPDSTRAFPGGQHA